MIIIKEKDILNYAISKMKCLEIFLRISEEKVRLEANNVNSLKN